jgi:hypothetical protein
VHVHDIKARTAMQEAVTTASARMDMARIEGSTAVWKLQHIYTALLLRLSIFRLARQSNG